MDPEIATRLVRLPAEPFARTPLCSRTQPDLRKLRNESKASWHNSRSSAGMRRCPLRSARRTQAFIFGLFCCFWLLGTLRGASTWDSIVSTGAQVDKKVVDITHYIRIGPKSGHHLLGCRVNVFAPTRYSSDEIGIADRF